MLTYTFSRREKVLLVILAVLLLGVVWYEFLFKGVQSQLSSLDQEISDTDTSITIDTAKLSQMSTMKSSIEKYKASGMTVGTTPSYDNLQNVMNELNSTLSGTSSYSLTFDDLDYSQSGIVRRGVTITYTSASYADAETVLEALANGTYTCSLDSFTIATGGTKSNSYLSSIIGSGTTTDTGTYTSTAHVTYTETR